MSQPMPRSRLALVQAAAVLLAAAGTPALAADAVAPRATASAAAPPAVAAGASAASSGATSAAAAPRPPADPVAPCESKVTESVHQSRGAKAAITFTTDAQLVHPGGGQVEVKGEGKYARDPKAAAVAFRYTCMFDEESRTASGVIFHEAESAAPPPPTSLTVWKADPSKILPEACESALAGNLRKMHPRAGNVVFDSMARRYEPAPGRGTALTGIGTITSPGLPDAVMHYRCEYDPDGRLTSARETP